MKAITFSVSIYPKVGNLYYSNGIEFQCSKINLPDSTIEVIPATTSIPKLVTFEKFFMMFGVQSGK